MEIVESINNRAFKKTTLTVKLCDCIAIIGNINKEIGINSLTYINIWYDLIYNSYLNLL